MPQYRNFLLYACYIRTTCTGTRISGIRFFSLLYEHLLSVSSRDEHTHCALVVCDSEWVSVALHSAFWQSHKVVTGLFACYMASAVWNWCRLGASSVYTIQPCTSSQCHNSKPQSYVGVCVFSCNLLPALLAGWPGSFTCYCGKTGVEGTPNYEPHGQRTQGKNILPPLLPGLEPETFRSQLRRSTTELSPLAAFRVLLSSIVYCDHRTRLLSA